MKARSDVHKTVERISLGGIEFEAVRMQSGRLQKIQELRVVGPSGNEHPGSFWGDSGDLDFLHVAQKFSHASLMIIYRDLKQDLLREVARILRATEALPERELSERLAYLQDAIEQEIESYKLGEGEPPFPMISKILEREPLCAGEQIAKLIIALKAVLELDNPQVSLIASEFARAWHDFHLAEGLNELVQDAETMASGRRTGAANGAEGARRKGERHAQEVTQAAEKLYREHPALRHNDSETARRIVAHGRVRLGQTRIRQILKAFRDNPLGHLSN